MQGSINNAALGLLQRAVRMHVNGWVVLLVRRLVSSDALEQSPLTVPWDPAAPWM